MTLESYIFKNSHLYTLLSSYSIVGFSLVTAITYQERSLNLTLPSPLLAAPKYYYDGVSYILRVLPPHSHPQRPGRISKTRALPAVSLLYTTPIPAYFLRQPPRSEVCPRDNRFFPSLCALLYAPKVSFYITLCQRN